MPNNEKMTAKDKTVYTLFGLNLLASVALAVLTFTFDNAKSNNTELQKKVDKSDFQAQNEAIYSAIKEGDTQVRSELEEHRKSDQAKFNVQMDLLKSMDSKINIILESK